MSSYSVLVVGESCEDVYIYGRCPRLSPEAPVPVFVQERIERVPGMVGNVKANLEALGLEVSFVTQEQRITKTRFVEESRNHCLLRVDDDPPLTPFNPNNVDPSWPIAVALVDYNKGFLSEQDISRFGREFTTTFLDTKKPLGDWCRDITFIKVNEPEFKASEAFVRGNPWMQDKLIVTLGAKGAFWRGKLYPVPHVVSVLDVTGAGDTFFAGFVAKYLVTQNTIEAIQVANECAASVVSKRGTAVVPPQFHSLLRPERHVL